MTHKRWMTKLVESSLHERRAALLLGPRQSGKTTLIRKLLPDHIDYRTLDDLTLLAAAKADPHTFVKRTDHLMAIDEIQRAPELLLAIKRELDESNEKGQYLLTGSANIRQLPTVTESLAGRVAKLQLRPLTQGEINGKQPTFLQEALAQTFTTPTQHYDQDSVIQLALRGGFPEPLTLNERARPSWHQDYLSALLDHDLMDITHIRRRDDMNQLLTVVAAWSSQYIDLSSIQAALSIKRPTIESYLNALGTLFLLDRLPAYATTDYARIGKRPKLYMTDSGLMASILNWRLDTIRLDSQKVGKLVETFIYNEIATHVSCHPGYQLTHYRDREKREIDLLVESDDQRLLGIEVKAGATLKHDHFKHLHWFQKNLSNDARSFVGIILYTGEHIVPFGKNLWGVPMGCLW